MIGVCLVMLHAYFLVAQTLEHQDITQFFGTTGLTKGMHGTIEIESYTYA